jgi:hypothetical protein
MGHKEQRQESRRRGIVELLEKHKLNNWCFLVCCFRII